MKLVKLSQIKDWLSSSKMYYKVKTFTMYKLYIKAQSENNNKMQQLSSWYQT